MAKKLTIKQAKFVKEYIKNDGNGTQAALKTYDTDDEKTASVISAENLGKPRIQEAIEKAMVKHEITPEAAIKPIADGLKAVRTLGEGEGEVIDHATRLKASGMALKLLGADKDDNKGGNTFNFTQINAEIKDKYAD